jgi:hypothetical protein
MFSADYFTSVFICNPQRWIHRSWIECHVADTFGRFCNPTELFFKIPHLPSFRGALNSLSWNPLIKNLKESCRKNNARLTQVMRDFLRVYRRTHNVKDRQCTYKHNIEARSCNHFCCGKAISTYSEWVFVALVIQHAKRMRRVMSSMACPAVQYFSTLSHKRHEKTKKKNGKNYWTSNVCCDSLDNFCLWNISYSEENGSRYKCV